MSAETAATSRAPFEGFTNGQAMPADLFPEPPSWNLVDWHDHAAGSIEMHRFYAGNVIGYDGAEEGDVITTEAHIWMVHSPSRFGAPSFPVLFDSEPAARIVFEQRAAEADRA